MPERPPRYEVTPQHPPMRVIVNVFWNGREFQARRWIHPHTKKQCWMHTRDGEQKYLPPRNDHKKPPSRQWGQNPEEWWPLKAETWDAPLPPPIEYDGGISVAGRFVNIQQRESDQSHEHDGSGLDHLPWWWQVDDDVPPVAYQVKGQIDADMAEGRLMRALAAAGVRSSVTFRRSEEGALQRIADGAEEWLREQAWNDQRHPPEFWMERLALDRADHKDWPIAMSWFAGLNPPDLWHKRRKAFDLNAEQRILLWRARAVGGPLSWQQIADQLGGRTRQAARNRYTRAIERIHRIANGEQAFAWIKPRDLLAELRERNRAFKRQGGQL